MSALLRVNIEQELYGCSTLEDVDSVYDKYKMSFKNAVDATEFQRMINNAKAFLSITN